MTSLKHKMTLLLSHASVTLCSLFQRARTYVLLTKIFLESILLATPYICVSRLDKRCRILSWTWNQVNSLLLSIPPIVVVYRRSEKWIL